MANDFLSTLTGAATAVGQTAVALKASSSLGQDPRKMSWNTIYAVAQTDPALGAQYAEIKRADELARAEKKQAKQLHKLGIKAAAAAPAPASNNNTLLLIGGGILLAVLLTRKKGR
jgi:hypothetical protein